MRVVSDHDTRGNDTGGGDLTTPRIELEYDPDRRLHDRLSCELVLSAWAFRRQPPRMVIKHCNVAETINACGWGSGELRRCVDSNPGQDSNLRTRLRGTEVLPIKAFTSHFPVTWQGSTVFGPQIYPWFVPRMLPRPP